MEKIAIRRYSVGFKQAIVREYEAGATATGLRKKYGIGGGSTIAGWVKRYGRYGTRHELMTIQRPEERDQLKALKARNAELEKLVADLSLDKLMLSSMVEVAQKEYGIDLKKTVAAKQSKPPKKKRRKFR